MRWELSDHVPCFAPLLTSVHISVILFRMCGTAESQNLVRKNPHIILLLSQVGTYNFWLKVRMFNGTGIARRLPTEFVT